MFYQSLVTSAATRILDLPPRDTYHAVIAVDNPKPNRAFYLPRLPPEYYRGDAVVHWTLSISRAA